MPAIAVIGAQWGDEGKGKIVDSLATQPNVVACGRFTGGDNAGHTIKPSPNEPSIALNIIPSSIVTGKPSIVGHGVLVNPITLYNEIEKLHGLGISTENLSVSLNSHVIMPYHRLEDYCLEKCKGSESVGTTNRGIGPCAADKANRIGIQMWELLNRELLSERLNFVIGLKQPLLEHVYQWDGIITDEKLRTAIGGYFEGHKIKKDAILDDCVALGNKLKKYLKETRELVNKYIKAGVVILESAQGALLDPDLGTWPYVTSTNPTIGGLLIGSGISHKEIAYVLGVMKAYTTRVGGGPFPTELKDETGDRIRKVGKEYGTTTGRPRRCGWFDAMPVNLAINENGIDGLALTKVDVLEGIEPIMFCVRYEIDGKPKNIIHSVGQNCLGMVKPVYIEHRRSLQEYKGELEAATAHIDILSFGPGREETRYNLSDELRNLLY